MLSSVQAADRLNSVASVKLRALSSIVFCGTGRPGHSRYDDPSGAVSVTWASIQKLAEPEPWFGIVTVGLALATPKQPCADQWCGTGLLPLESE